MPWIPNTVIAQASGSVQPDLPWFNVRDYGATGDSVTDDSGAIQDAINAAANEDFPGLGGVVFFPSGIYYIATGLTCTRAGTSFIGQGQSGLSSEVSTGITQIVVGNNIWGLTLGNTSGEYRGYRMENLQFWEKNAAQAHGGVKLNTSNYGIFQNCAFGKFTKSVSTTIDAAADGDALSTLGTLPLVSTTGWPTSGSGWLRAVPGVGGQIYHSFWYTGVSGNSLTGVTYNAPDTDTVETGAEVWCAVGVGFLNNGGAGGAGESSNNRFVNCNFGSCQFGVVQQGINLCFYEACQFDGNGNDLYANMGEVPPGATGLMAVSGAVLASNCEAQSWDVCVHLGKGNQLSNLDFRLEGWGSAGVIIEADAGEGPGVKVSASGGSNVVGAGPAVVVKPDVTGLWIEKLPYGDATIDDQGTGTRYFMLNGIADAGPSVTGTVVGRQAVYNSSTGALIGYTPIYDSIGGVYLVRTLLTFSQTVDVTGGGVTSIDGTITTGVPVGSFLVIGGGYSQASTRTITPSDSKGNTWQVDRHDDKTTGQTPHSFVASSEITTALEVGDTITVTFSGLASLPAMAVYQYAGMPTGTWVDAVIGSTGTSTTPGSTSLTTADDSELLFASAFYQVPSPDTAIPGTGYEILEGPYNIVATKEIFSESRTSGAAGSFSADATLGSSVDWAISLVAYKRA